MLFCGGITRAKIGADWMEDQHSARGGMGGNALTANTMYLNKPRINDQYFKNYGIYAEATWQMSDKNRLIAGLRRDKTKAEYETGYAGFANVNGTAWQKQTYNLNAGFARFEHQRNDWTYYAGVGFIDAQGRLVQINHMQPRSLEHHCAKQPILYALEVNQGWFERNNVRVQTRVLEPQK